MGTQLMEALAGLERRDAQRLARVKRLAGLALALAKTAGTLRVTEQSVLSALYNPDAASALEQLAEIVADLAPQPEVA